jgi:hypothetical protein
MPAGYDIGLIGVTATTTSAAQAAFLTTTAANKPNCQITAVWADCGGNAMTTAGGGYMNGNTWQTVGVVTTSTVANKKNFFSAANSTAVSATAANIAVGTGTAFSRIFVGFAQTGGTGFWMASSPDMAWQLPQGGTVNGYGDFISRTATASMLLNFQIEFVES